MASSLNEVLAPGKAIYQLVVDAQERLEGDRRSEVRFPLFRPVSIQTDDGRMLAAFCREISTFGIGLVHDAELKLGAVEISISTQQGYAIRVRTHIIWCESCGEGWYASGGRFVGIAGVGG
jgi:hypothetical protein